MSTPTLSESCVCGATIRVTSPNADEPQAWTDQFRRHHQPCRHANDRHQRNSEETA